MLPGSTAKRLTAENAENAENGTNWGNDGEASASSRIRVLRRNEVGSEGDKSLVQYTGVRTNARSRFDANHQVVR
jgi:hypothetical protein